MKRKLLVIGAMLGLLSSNAGAGGAADDFRARLASLTPAPGHDVAVRQEDGGAVLLITRPAGQDAESWTEQFMVRAASAGEGGMMADMERLFDQVDALYQGCEDPIYQLNSLSVQIDGEHVARTLLAGCAAQRTAQGEKVEAAAVRLVSGAQGRFLILWAERLPADGTVTYGRLERLYDSLNAHDPIYGWRAQALSAR